MDQAMTVQRNCSSACTRRPLRRRARCAALGMVVQEPPVGGVMKYRIADGAQDQAMPGFIDCTRGHPDDLAVAQRYRAASKPLPQTGFDEFTRLPGAGLRTASGNSRSAITCPAAWQRAPAFAA